VIKGKTAKLFAAAAEVGAMVAGRNGPSAWRSKASA
jgi:geranylgeranyl pyrophosphate synthase